MKDRRHRSRLPGGSDETANFTQTLRSLSETGTSADAHGEFGEPPQTALIVCRDSAARKWGPRWLRDEGLHAAFAPDVADALSTARSICPSVIIVDAGLKARSGELLFDQLTAAADVEAPIIALCAGSRDVTAAMDGGAYEIVRKPYDWRLIANRAKKTAQARASAQRLGEAHDSLNKALSVAESARERLRSRESFEPVTGLPNRSKFLELLGRGMAAADRDNNALAVVVIGFNRFRLVIEALGQDNANLVLAEVGGLLSDALRDAASAQANTHGLKTAAAAIIDSSRFGMMLTCSGDGDELAELQQMLVSRLSRPVQVSGQTIYLSACVGATVYPDDAGDPDGLLQRADNAMRDAQSRGGGFKFYCAETDAAAARKLKLEHMLHEAFVNEQLSIEYQPLTETATGQITGAEALLRWRQPDNSYISPVEFVPIAEESGLMIRIGEYVLDKACGQLKSWQEQGLPISHMCVNVSKCQLMSGEFVESVGRILYEHQIRPECLELELSERGVLSGDYDVISQLHALRHLGVKLSIDDFGTGDSAMAYLRELPIDVMKIDRSYINGLAENEKDAAITSAMVALGQRLNLKVVAEGVESEAQLDVVRGLGCDEYQGFLQSPAVAAQVFARLLQAPGK
ncbi:MAG: EAL domain-containing protein [Gammaproteobacteria bacterium]|nr:EAL domain-containing protein [Gammaproteobacteria bacterium]